MSYNLLVATIGEPFGYKTAEYQIDGQAVKAVYTASALSQRYSIPRTLIVGLEGVRFPESTESIEERLAEIGSDAAAGDEFRARSEFLKTKPDDVYGFFLEKTGYRPFGECSVIRVNSSDVVGRVAEKVIEFMLPEEGDSLKVMLDITHGVNYLPVLVERGVEFGLQAASFMTGKKVGLDIVASLSVRKALKGPLLEGQIERYESTRFNPFSSVKQATWRLIYEGRGTETASLLAFFFEISAPIAVLKLLSEEKNEINGGSGEMPFIARYFVDWMKRNTEGMWQNGSVTIEGIKDFMNRLVARADPIGKVALQSEIHKLGRLIAKMPFRGNTTLKELKGEAGYISEDSGDRLMRNFIAHAGFLDEAVTIQRTGGTYSLMYNGLWEKIKEQSREYIMNMVK